MGAITLYDAYFPILFKSLGAVDNILADAEAHAKENNLTADAEYPEARLIADMYTFTKQIQTMTRTIKTTVSLLKGQEVENWPEEEKTFADLRARVQNTRDLLHQVKPEEINGREDETVTLDALKLTLPIKDWLSSITLPNVFFHLTIAYGILRSKGVPLGKKLFLTSFVDPLNQSNAA